MEVRSKILALFLFLATIAGAQGVTDTCDYLEGGILERQMQTGITGLLRGSGYCVQSTVVNGGLEMVGATLSVVDGDTTGQVLRWNGTTWVPRLIIFPASEVGVDTAYNGLTDRDTAFVLGGPLVEHTTITGQQAYDFYLSNMRTIYMEAQRTSGVAFSSVTMGSTAAAGVDFAHYNEADNQKQAVAAVNYSTGNVVKIQDSASNGTYFQQYDNGGGLFQTDITSSNGADSKTIRVNRDAVFIINLEALDITNEAAFMMIDTFTGELKYKSPADFAGLYGDDWGSQTVSSTARFSGVGTVGSPLELAQQSAASGQVLKWNGTAWAPAADAGASSANLTAASSKVAITGGTGAVLTAATVDVTEANLTLNNIGGTLGIAKGGTNMTAVGVNGTVLGSDGSAALWLTPNIVTDGVTTNFTRSGATLTATVPPATFSAGGIVTTSSQTFSGAKIFSNFVNVGGGLGSSATSSFAAVDAVGVADAAYNVVTTTTTLDHTYNFVAIGTLSNNRTMNLPSCTSTRDGWEYRFLKTGSDIYTVTIDPNGSETFTDGTFSKVFDGQNSGAFCKCRWDGGAGTWFYSQSFAPSQVVYTSTPGTSGQTLRHDGSVWQPTSNLYSGAAGIGIFTASPAQTLHVQGTARITGSDGTATGIMGRDADGDISGVSLNSRLEISGGALDIAQQSATSGQVLKWSGTAWTPASDAGATAANLTAASSKVAITGGTGAVLNAATVDVTEANLSLSSIGGTLGVGQITNGTTGSFLRSGASVPAWETAASLQGSLLLPSGTSTQTLRHNGSAWVANSILANDGAFIGIGTTSPSSILDIRRPGNDAFLNLTGYDAKIKVGGTLGGNQTYSAQFVLESENAGVREVITEIVPSTRSTALYRYYGAEVTNSYTGYDGVVRCNPSAYPFYQRMWAAGGQFDIGVILRTDGQTFTYTDMAPYMTVRSSGNVGIGQESPAQKLDVNGTVRIVGSSGTATGLMGRDADGDVSGVGLSVGLEFSGSNIQVDVGSGLNVSGNSIAWGGTLTENTTQDFDTYDVFFTNMPTSTTEDEALVIDSGTGKLARGQIPITAIRNPGEATYLGDNGGTGETVTWQPEDILVEADPTAGHLTVELNTSMKQGLAYSLFGCCNLTYNITLNSGTMKITGSYGTTSSYVLGAGEHLEVIRMSSNTFYISKK